MTWDKDASDILTMWRDRLRKAATIQRLFGTAFKLHYPEIRLVDGVDDHGVVIPADPFPGGVLFEETQSIMRSGEGECDDAPGNSVSADFYFDPVKHSIAKVEREIGVLCRELCEWTTEGLAILRATRTRASKPAQSQVAGANDADGVAYRTISVVAWYS